MGTGGGDHPACVAFTHLCQNPQAVNACLGPAIAERGLHSKRRPFRDQLVERRVAHADAAGVRHMGT